MKTYKLTQVIKLSSGSVKLTDKQYASRTHLVSKPDNDGVSEIQHTIMFKANEEFVYDGEIPKSHLSAEAAAEEAAAKHDQLIKDVKELEEAEEAARVAAEEAAAKAAEEPAEGSDARFDVIVAAIQKLDPDNADQFTKTGVPDANVLTEHLGWKVSAAERDEAWEAIQEG